MSQPYLEIEGTIRWKINHYTFLYAHNNGQIDIVTSNSRSELSLGATFAAGELKGFFDSL